MPNCEIVGSAFDDSELVGYRVVKRELEVKLVSYSAIYLK